MKTFLKNYRHLTALALVLCLAVLGVALGIFKPQAAFVIIGLWQLAELAISKRRPGVFRLGVISESQAKEFTQILDDIKKKIGVWDKCATELESLGKLYDDLRAQVAKAKRSGFGAGGQVGIRWINGVPFLSDEAAKALVTDFLLQCDGLPKPRRRAVPAPALPLDMETTDTASEATGPDLDAPDAPGQVASRQIMLAAPQAIPAPRRGHFNEALTAV